MEVYEVILLCVVNLMSFVIGAKIGQHSTNGKSIELNPIKAIKNDIRANKEMKKKDLQQRKMDINYSNIDNYNGTGLGQTKIPDE